MVRHKKPKEPALLRDHIREMTRRLIVVAIVAIVASSVAYNYQKEIVAWLLAPLGTQKLMYITPGGGFNFIFQVTMNIGIACAIPVAFYNLFRFIAPALPKHIRRVSATMAIASLGLMLTGIAFGYYVAIPGAMRFLTTVAADYINASLTADSYLNFVLTYTIGLSILFQLPLIFLLIHWVKPLKPKTLLKGERWAIIGAFVVAALITPTPDIVNQVLVAAPLIIMYQMGVTLVAISIYREKRHLKKQQNYYSRQVTPSAASVKSKKMRSSRGFVAYQQEKRQTLKSAAATTESLNRLSSISEAKVASVGPSAHSAIKPSTSKIYMDFVPGRPVAPRHHERAAPLANYSSQRLQMKTSIARPRTLATNATGGFSIDGITPRRVIHE